MLTRRRFLMASGASLLVPASGWAAEGVTTVGGSALGSYWRLTAPPEVVTEAAAALVSIIDSVDQTFSPYRGDSALTGFNRSSSTDWQGTTEQLHRVLSAAMDLAASSNGAFDPTVGPMVSRFGFGPITGATGRYSEIDLSADAVRKHRGGLSIDLCGIAKGHALDLMTARLTEAGITSFLLDLGGELAARGQHPSGRSWQVAVDAPWGGLTQSFALSDRSVATSGTTVQGYRVGASKLGHIIDPATRRPSATNAVSVSVLSDSATISDGWATALMAMPYADAAAMATARGLDTLFLVPDETGFSHSTTGNFARHLLG